MLRQNLSDRSSFAILLHGPDKMSEINRDWFEYCSLFFSFLLTLPSSPDEMRISMPYTSPSANVAVSKSFRWTSDGFKIIRFFPSITF